MNKTSPPKLLSSPQFVTAAHSHGQWPPDTGVEVAFAGRSNVGKSSAINAITNRRSLARTSRTPGRTQQIVFFSLSETQSMVDLPGYGYAKVPANLRNHWSTEIERYLVSRESLAGLILLMDARHPLTVLDRQMLDWSVSANLPVYVLLTKIDKLSRNQGAIAIRKVGKAMEPFDSVTVQPFSAMNHTGVQEARGQIVEWLKEIDEPA